jgi:uncharacterized membrane protein
VAVVRGVLLYGPVILFVCIAGVLADWLLPATSPWITSVFLVQTGLASCLIAGRLPMPYRCLLAVAAVTVAAWTIHWLGLPARSAGIVLAGVCHTVAYASLLVWFISSLQRGREPVVTGFARQVRRTMPPEVVRYTRHVTAAWCVFFAGQLLASWALLIAAPEAMWAAFLTVWNLPLIVAMALAEFATRAILFRRHQRTGVLATLAAMRNVRIMPGGRS